MTVVEMVYADSFNEWTHHPWVTNVAKLFCFTCWSEVGSPFSIKAVRGLFTRETIYLPQGKATWHSCQVIVFWTLDLRMPYLLLYRIELIAQHLRCLKRGMSTRFFEPAAHDSWFMHGPHYKMALYCIFAWWEIRYIVTIHLPLESMLDKFTTYTIQVIFKILIWCLVITVVSIKYFLKYIKYIDKSLEYIW